MKTSTILFGWVRIVCGLFVFAFGVHLTIRADIGLAPWDCLGMGISYHTPLNYGLAMTSMAVVIVIIDLLLGEKIGYGTVIDALLTGNFVQLFNTIDTLPHTRNSFVSIGIMLVGLIFMALGQYLYMKSEQCCGPRDALLIGLGKKLRFLPIGAVQILLWGMVLLAGWLLGGPVGIGTLISTFGGGVVTQMVYRLLQFEPRELAHKSVIQITKVLLDKKQSENP